MTAENGRGNSSRMVLIILLGSRLRYMAEYFSIRPHSPDKTWDLLLSAVLFLSFSNVFFWECSYNAPKNAHGLNKTDVI